MTLSDKRDNFLDMNKDKWLYYEKDVREAVKELREIIELHYGDSRLTIERLTRIIDEIFGDLAK